jgi:signal transduction histidine kinase
MAPAVRSSAVRYGFAVAAVLTALAARLLLDPFVGDRLPVLFFALAIVAVAWHGGFGPSCLALLLSIPAASYFFFQPRHDLAASLPDHQVQLVGFVFLGLTIGLFSGRLRAARLRAEDNAREADRRRQELEVEVARREVLERELQRRAADLADADRRKDEFLAMLAHELRNPLASIRNSAWLIRSLAVGDDLRWPAGSIERQVGHLARLVDDLLDVSRVSRGKLTLLKQEIDLADVVRRAAEASRPLLEARGHELTVELPQEPAWVQGDSTRLEQVVCNLLNNAAKYVPDGGHVRLSVRREGAEVVVRVSDDGIGISADLLPRVFDLFAQGDRSLARSEGGLGIGLTLVKSLAEMHDGSAEARSEGPGKGSEFTVRLPAITVTADGERRARDEAKNAEPLATLPSVIARSRRVLAVDDNADAVESLAVLLGMQGHQVRTAHDGPDALEQAEAFRPEVVILDVGLPRMDGYEVARRLREREGMRGVLLVALTGYGREEDRRRSLEAGFDRHLVKPVDPDVLRDVLGLPSPPATS